MSKKNVIILFAFSILFFSLSLVGVYIYGQTTIVWHSADEITPGTFQIGDYKFPGSSRVSIGTNDFPNKLNVVSDEGGEFTSFQTSNTGNSWVRIQNGVTGMNLGIGNITPHPYIWSWSNLFFIGNDGNPTLFVDGMGNGNVYVGTVFPSRQAKLVVRDNYSGCGEVGLGGGVNYDMWVDPGTEEDFWITYAGCADDAACHIEDLVFNFNPHGTNYHAMSLNMLSGNLWLKGGLNADWVVQRSSIRYKKNLEKSNISFLDRVKNIQPYFYNFKSEQTNDKKHFGYLAEDLPKEILAKDGNVDMMAYNGMLLKLIQEQQELLEKQQREIKILQKEIQRLKNSKK